MAVPVHVHAGLWFDQDEQDRFFACLGRTLTISLILHVLVLLVVVGLRLAPGGERPLASVEVSLVSLAKPLRQVEVPKQVKRVQPEPAPVLPPPAKEVEPPPVKMEEAAVAPALAPPMRPMTPTPIPLPSLPRASRAKDILRDIELPPEAPKIGDLSPVKSVGEPRPETKSKVKLPDLPQIPDMIPDQTVKTPQHSSISEELNRELDQELKKVKAYKPTAKLEIPKDEPIKPMSRQQVAIPQVKAPQTQLKTSGSSGTNPYWARIESIIKSHWEPPPIDVTGQTYSVVVKFRFYRNGTVKDVGIQQTSGNSYFDMAGQRAVLKPRQYPPFPADMSESYQDVEMVFRVGEATG